MPRHRPADCICFNLRKAARAVTQEYDAALQPSGLKATQFSLLAMAERLGPGPMARLAEELVMDRTTLTRNLRPLEKQGLIRIQPGEDRRARLVEVTPAGRDALARALPLWQRTQARMREGLGLGTDDLLRQLHAAVTVAQGR